MDRHNRLRAFLWQAREKTRNARSALGGVDVVEFRRLTAQGRITMGAWSYGVPTVRTYPLDDTALRVGKYTSIAGGATVLLGGNHATDRVTTFPHRIWMNIEGAGTDGFPVPTGDTVIGSDVWICAGALLVSGVTIGDGAIVAAGAVVVKDVEPYAIVGGNPARVIRHRYPAEIRAELLEIAWWDWPDDEVRRVVPLLSGDDVDAFLRHARARRG